MSRSGQQTAYVLYRATESFVRLVPLSLCAIGGRFAGWLLSWFLVSRFRSIRRNIALALGEETGPGEARRIARRHFAAWGRNFFLQMRLSYLNAEALERRIRIEGDEKVEHLLDKGSGIIAAICHMGPWEILSTVRLFGDHTRRGLIHRPTSNPRLNSYLVDAYAAQGTTVFDITKGLFAPLRHLQKGGSLSILSDEHPAELGVWYPFFDRLASTSNLPALLAERTNVPLVPIALYPEGLTRWRVSFGDPILPRNPGGEPVAPASMTLKLNEEFEKLIRYMPEEWHWPEDHWTTPPPEVLLTRYDRHIRIDPAQSKRLKSCRILVRTPDELDEACFAVPAVRAIKLGRPDAHVTVLSNDETGDIWHAVRHVDEVIVKPGKTHVLHARQLLKRVPKFEAAIVLNNSARAAMELKMAGVSPRIGPESSGGSRFLDFAMPVPAHAGPGEHRSRHYLRIAESAGADISDPVIFENRTREKTAPSRWRIGLSPGSPSARTGRYPAERLTRAVEDLHEALDGNVDWVLHGAPDEPGAAAEFISECGIPIQDPSGRSALHEVIDDLRSCHLVIANDSGILQLAALCGIPTVALFGPTEPRLTAPLGTGHRILRHHVECSPCFLAECPLDFRCMLAIDPAEIVRAGLAITEEYGQALPAEAAGQT